MSDDACGKRFDLRFILASSLKKFNRDSGKGNEILYVKPFHRRARKWSYKSTRYKLQYFRLTDCEELGEAFEASVMALGYRNFYARLIVENLSLTREGEEVI